MNVIVRLLGFLVNVDIADFSTQEEVFSDIATPYVPTPALRVILKSSPAYRFFNSL